MYVCRVCEDAKPRLQYNCVRHEGSGAHKNNLLRFRSRQAEAAVAAQPAAREQRPLDAAISDDGIRHLLSSLTGGAVAPYPLAARNNSPPPDIGLNWNLMEANNEGNLSLSADQQAVAQIAEGILGRFDELPMSDDEFEERSEGEEEAQNEPEVAGTVVPLSNSFCN